MPVQEDGRVLSLQYLEEQRKRSRFQKEDSECDLKVPKGPPEVVHRALKWGQGLKREIRARDTKVESSSWRGGGDS